MSRRISWVVYAFVGIATSRCSPIARSYADLPAGSFDWVDLIVLNTYYSLGTTRAGSAPGGGSWHNDGDATLDNPHLMRLAGRLAQRARAWARPTTCW